MVTMHVLMAQYILVVIYATMHAIELMHLAIKFDLSVRLLSDNS